MTLEMKTLIDNWSKQTGLKVRYFNGGFEVIPVLDRKGAYVQELSPLNYDLAVINRAIVENFTNGTPVEETVRSCTDLYDFQKIVKVSSKFDFAVHNRKKIYGKVFRVFASKDRADGAIKKGRNDGTLGKFGNTPAHCFIYNGDVKGLKVSDFPQFDIEYYVDLAKNRLKEKFNIYDRSGDLFEDL